MLELIYATPEEVGIPSASVCNLCNQLANYHIPMHSIHIARYGKIIMDGYYKPFQKNQLHRMFSITKTLVGLAVLKFSEAGTLNLWVPIVKYFPEFIPSHPHPWLL